MGLPKRKTSKSNRDSRRTHWKIEAPTLSECPRCHTPKLPYYACPSCGFYKGRQVIKIKEKKEKR